MSHNTLKAPIGFGHTAEIYSWQEGYVLKLFRDWFRLSAIEHEAQVARLVHQAGLPVPAILDDIVEIDGQYGLIYERVIGVSMLEALKSKPWLVYRYAKCLAELQDTIHRQSAIQGLPAQHEKLREKIRSVDMLSSEIKETVVRMLEKLPTGSQLCHGDFHSDNVLLTENGLMIIDWIEASNGNPLSDVARTSILLNIAQPPDTSRMSCIVNRFRGLLHRIYLKRYFQLHPHGQKEFKM